jgi:hypothetical protein
MSSQYLSIPGLLLPPLPVPEELADRLSDDFGAIGPTDRRPAAARGTAAPGDAIDSSKQVLIY